MKPHNRLARRDREIWHRETQDLKPLHGEKKRDAAGPAGTTAPERPRRRPDPAQDEAWIEFTQEIEPLRARSKGEPPRSVPGEDEEADTVAGPGAKDRHRTGPERQSAPGTYSLDRRTEGRLRRGRIEPESRLDLHGMRYVVARQGSRNS